LQSLVWSYTIHYAHGILQFENRRIRLESGVLHSVKIIEFVDY